MLKISVGSRASQFEKQDFFVEKITKLCRQGFEPQTFLHSMVFCYQNCPSDREKLLKFEAESRGFARFLRSLEQFIQTLKGQNNF